MGKTKAAIIGSGNIGTDLMMKILNKSKLLELSAMVGIDPESDGLAKAKGLGIRTTHEGADGLIAMEDFNTIEIIFDATSAKAHEANAAKLAPYGKRFIDLTPAAIGPFVVPAVNLDQHLGSANVNMVTCGGQATIPVVAAIAQIAQVEYAEIVASISSRSAGPGTRANIDEFTETTAQAIKVVGGATHSKAIIILNPAEPPMIMRDTVFCLINTKDHDVTEQVRCSVEKMVAAVAVYVPGYRLKQQVQVMRIPEGQPMRTLVGDAAVTHQVSVFLEVEGAADYLPAYAGNLDIMTSAALRTGERLVAANAEGAFA